MIELIFITPLLFALILAAFEFSQMFIQAQRVSSLSRETANAVFRDCSSFPNDQLENCVELLREDINLGAKSLLKDFNTDRGRVVVSIYKWRKEHEEDKNSVVLAYPSIADIASHINLDNVDQTILEDQGVIVVAEVFYRYIPSTIVGNLLNLKSIGQLYEITIY
ncbi:MAG: hypothetical protein AUJ72_03745 [Candidatus Omnitrophica bacterium CG1_02_46_14]|nr:MAG: hypothetical protein AUJ72_03745 [Candidatus Omnitrophica bacterium CG1_02_46_14]